MKKISLKILIVTAFLSLSPSNATADAPAFQTAVERVATDVALEGRLIQVQVNGMVCDFCAQSLIKVLEKKEAVEKVDISLEAKLMIITVKQGLSLEDAEIEEAVYWAGYEIAKIERV